jgi:hypothetical protein
MMDAFFQSHWRNYCGHGHVFRLMRVAAAKTAQGKNASKRRPFYLPWSFFFIVFFLSTLAVLEVTCNAERGGVSKAKRGTSGGTNAFLFSQEPSIHAGFRRYLIDPSKNDRGRSGIQ